MMGFFQRAAEMEAAGQSFVVITLARVQISAPGEEGAQAIVGEQGLVEGTIGGGKVEAKAISKALQMLRVPTECRLQREEWNLREDVGMTCGGIVNLVFQRYSSAAWRILIFGAGHVSQALIPLLLTLDCEIDVVDPRGDWLERMPGHVRLNRHQVDAYEDGVSLVGDDHFVLSLSMGHSYDVPILKKLLDRESLPRFLGVIGSEAKARTIRRELHQLGYSADRTSKIQCPVGLKVGNNSPAEIAVSMAAGLIQARDGCAV